jgi:uncharacterized protein (DUF362 family)
MNAAQVAVVHSTGSYPEEFPYHPSEPYPEHVARPRAAAPNPAYAAVRAAFENLGLDREHQGGASWNPLRGLIQPGERVFLKPNLVSHEYRASCGKSGDLYAVISHPSVIRAVADYVALALEGRGELVIGDNPSIDCDFPALCERTGLHRFPQFYADTFGLSCRVVDLRPLICKDLREYGVRSFMASGPGDPEGSQTVDLGRNSFFAGISPWLLRGVFTRRGETLRAHSAGRHVYTFSKTMLNADVFISVPKLKAHHKVGATLNIKGLVGTVHSKNELPHWRIGFPSVGGDEFSEPALSDKLLLFGRHLLTDALPDRAFLGLKQRLRGTPLELLFADTRLTSSHCSRGAWHGNDTCWRMAADLYQAFVQDASGTARPGRRTRFFSVVDGIRAGEGNGPFCPDPREARIILAGHSLLATDVVAVRLMDYAMHAVPYLTPLLAREHLQAEAIHVLVDGIPDPGFFESNRRYLEFRAPSGWPRLPLHVQASESNFHHQVSP